MYKYASQYTCVVFSLVWLMLIKPTCAVASPEALLHMQKAAVQTWPAVYTLTLTVPAHHHAYLDRGDEQVYIPIQADPGETLAAAGVRISRLEKPTGVYDAEVQATVLKNRGIFRLYLDRLVAPAAQLPETVEFEFRYQLCDEVSNVCFRPKTARVTVPLPTAMPSGSTPVTTEPPATQPASLSERLLQVFARHQDNTAVIFGLMVLAGLLSVATPCVYPMLPITSMLILKRAGGQPRRETWHALAYTAGIIGTYALLGLLAGLSGGTFNALMQSAMVNLLFAALFSFFALSLLGFYELGFLQNEVQELDQRSAHVSGLTGTWLMGGVAGLVISPCVGPIVFALLLQVADTMAAQAEALAVANQALSFQDQLRIASRGGWMMAGFGLGIGVPFFLTGVLKFRQLPKSGVWMNRIKCAFGLVILYLAYGYLEKGMGIWGVSSPATVCVAAGLVAIWLAVVHCRVLTLRPADTQASDSLYQYCGVLSLILGSWLLLVGLNRTPLAQNGYETQAAVAQPTRSQAVAHEATEKSGGITWYRTLQAAQTAARSSGKPVFVDFYASWCANCKAFQVETVENRRLNQSLRTRAISLKLVDQEADFERFRRHPQHRPLKIGLPYFAILDPNGEILWSGSDYTATEQMIAVLEQWQT